MSRRRGSLLFAAAALALVVLLAPWTPSSTLGALAASARITVLVGVGAAVAGGAAGLLLAGVGVLVGGRAEAAVTRVAELAGALPSVLVVPLVALAPGGRIELRVLVALAIVRAAETAHVVRTLARSLDAEEFVRAAVALGASRLRVVSVHMLPHVAPALATTLASGAAAAVALEVAVSFVGLAPGASGLGAFAAEALAGGRPTIAIASAVIVTALLAPLLAVADRLRDQLDPRARALPG